MASDLISREALFDAMREKEWQNWPPLDEIDAVIEKAPAVDAEPVRHGEWVRDKENCLHNKCSVCEYRHCREDNYCPNCGAKMDGGKQDANV